MKSTEIRKQFLDYFAKKQHAVVPSASLIPGNDPTLLFTNAGMVPFKDVFLGKEECSYTRATSSQRCVRAGGKHNDLENVGYTARHHTFFEMLGNFSFGDYFKRDAIKFAWEFLTGVLQLSPERLWVTVFNEDDETADIWLKEMKISPKRFSRCGAKDNFWSMGDTGPCGPCTEIFYDHGADISGGPPGSPDEDADRYIEIWNLVFMQYNRAVDGTLATLKKQSVDTGMGLERLTAVLQGVHNNYETDLFMPIIEYTAKLLGMTDYADKSLRVIADHIRSTAFLMIDGVRPSNEGRGYVLRRIMRRAIRHGHKLGFKEAFFFKLLKPLSEVMGEAYPQLLKQQLILEETIMREEAQFATTIEQGMHLLERELDGLSGTEIPGAVVFKLYDTYGFPADLTADIARERGFTIDEVGLEMAMSVQRARSKASGQFKVDLTKSLQLSGKTDFLGYEKLQLKAKVLNLFSAGVPVNQLSAGEDGIVVLDQTPFYAESGGQVGDVGQISFFSSEPSEFVVKDVQKQGGVFLHIGHMVKGSFKINLEVLAEVGDANREKIKANHSATHLLHAALQKVLGRHVVQKGSLVSADYLRFDFMHPQAMTAEEVAKVEALVLKEIEQDSEAKTELMSPEKAKEAGAVALFGEKYGDTVRVLSLGEFSKELCGGTHVKRTADIGRFKIIRETGVAAGIRRVEAYTADKVQEYLNNAQAALEESIEQQQMRIQTLEKTLVGLRQQTTGEVRLKVFDISTLSGTLDEKIKQQQLHIKNLDKAIAKLQAQLSIEAGSQLKQNAVNILGINVLAEIIKNADAKSLRVTLDQLKDKLSPAIIVLAAVKGDQVSLVAGVDKTLTSQFHAGKLINFIAQQLDGKGGGRPDMAQAGAKHPEKLSSVLSSVEGWVSKQSS